MKDLLKITTRTTEKELDLMKLVQEQSHQLAILQVYIDGEELGKVVTNLMQLNSKLEKEIKVVREANKELVNTINQKQIKEVKKIRQLTEQERDMIAEMYSYFSVKELASGYDVTRNTIVNILQAKGLYAKKEGPGRPKVE